MMELASLKSDARTAAYERRRVAHGAGRGSAAHLARVLERHRGAPVSGYLPIRTEIDPRPAMEDAAAHGRVGVPVILGAGQPLKFRLWTPGCALVRGPFGAMVPEDGDWMVPQVVVLPLVAFTRAGHRLGYGGGFYDRTLQGLRAAGPVVAIGFAYAAQEAETLPIEPTDQPLDLIVTEDRVIEP